MTTQQPEALRLAGMLRTESDSEVGVVKYSTAKKAEQELRRQHARIVELEAELAAAPQALQAVVSVAHRHEFTDGHRTLKQDVFSAIHDYAATKPEQDPDDQESWESWFEAAFDLLGTRVGQIFEEHAERSAPAHPAEAVPDERAAFEQWLGIKPCGAAHDFGWAAWRARAALAATQTAAQEVDAKDAARYRFLRDGDWRENDAVAPFVHLQLNALWDEKIDAAIAAQAKQGGAA